MVVSHLHSITYCFVAHSRPIQGESRGAVFAGVTHLAGTDFGAICPTNLSHLDEPVCVVPHVESTETLTSNAVVTHLAGTLELMTQESDG